MASICPSQCVCLLIQIEEKRMSASRNWAFIHEKMPVREHERARASETEESEAWKLFRCASRARFDPENEKNTSRKCCVSWNIQSVDCGNSLDRVGENYKQKSVNLFAYLFKICNLLPSNSIDATCKRRVIALSLWKIKKVFFIILELMWKVIKCLFSYQSVKWLWLVDTFSIYWDIFALNFIQMPWTRDELSI